MALSKYIFIQNSPYNHLSYSKSELMLLIFYNITLKQIHFGLCTYVYYDLLVSIKKDKKA